MKTESANYGPRANITSIPPAVSERDDFIYIRKNSIHRIPANAFLSYSNLKSLILVWVDLQYSEEGAFNGQGKLDTFNIRHGRALLQLPSDFGPPIKSLVYIIYDGGTRYYQV